MAGHQGQGIRQKAKVPQTLGTTKCSKYNSEQERSISDLTKLVISRGEEANTR